VRGTADIARAATTTKGKRTTFTLRVIARKSNQRGEKGGGTARDSGKSPRGESGKSRENLSNLLSVKSGHGEKTTTTKFPRFFQGKVSDNEKRS